MLAICLLVGVRSSCITIQSIVIASSIANQINKEKKGETLRWFSYSYQESSVVSSFWILHVC